MSGHPYTVTLAALEAALRTMYATANLSEAARAYRAELARAYHDRTGTYYAARFYCAGRPA
jgi:hypothetical protein